MSIVGYWWGHNEGNAIIGSKYQIDDIDDINNDRDDDNNAKEDDSIADNNCLPIYMQEIW